MGWRAGQCSNLSAFDDSADKTAVITGILLVSFRCCCFVSAGENAGTAARFPSAASRPAYLGGKSGRWTGSTAYGAIRGGGCLAGFGAAPSLFL